MIAFGVWLLCRVMQGMQGFPYLPHYREVFTVRLII